jgi:hypothetical protein
MKIYIGGAVQNLSESEYLTSTEKIHWLKTKLEKKGHEILNYKSMLNRESSPTEIYEYDYRNCMECDAMIAIAHNPSTGLGMEIVTCLTRTFNGYSRPAFVFATAAVDTNVSKLLVGWQHYAFVFTRYQKFEQIPGIFEKVRRAWFTNH